MKPQDMEEGYFSVHNLDKLAEIDRHMSFLETLTEKYSRMPQDAGQTGAAGFDWNLVGEQLGLIRKKMKEKKLNISVIGEFSTGKSTFINALLRKELLASSALQGTTVASTIFDYDSRYRIHLEYLDGRKDQKLVYPAFSDLKDDLDRYTTVPETAKQLKTVRVYLPSEILKKNFRIIDTPGTNVTEAWHEDVTVRTLKNNSDLSIVLISAEKPAPETMIKFLKKNLKSILPQCVFIVTKLDLIRKRERMQQLSYVKMKLEEELELKEAVVLPYISPTVLDSQVPDSERCGKQRKIWILGESGSGKRTLAEAILGEKISKDVLPPSPVIKISCDMNLNIADMTDIIMLLNAAQVLNNAERDVIERLIKSFDREKIIFAVNKMDVIKPEEVPGIKEYVERVLSSMVSAPRICYVSACEGEEGIKELTRMMEIGSEQDISVDEELLQLSLETERKLVEHTVKQRTLAITKKLAELIDDVYLSISQKIEQTSAAYEERLELLERSGKTDLSIFVLQEKPDRLRHFDEGAKKVLDEMEELLAYFSDSAKEEILGKLDDKRSIDTMKTYISTALGTDCQLRAMEMISVIDSYYGCIQKQFREEMDIYNNAFIKNYEMLNIMPLDMKQSKYNLPEDIEIETANISSAANYIAEQLSSENKAFFGGAAAGAAIGTAIAPGFGTLIGGVVGFFAGGGFAPNTNTVRNECKGKLEKQLMSYYNSISNKMVLGLEQYTRQIQQCLDDEIDGYLDRYKREVERMIAEENSQKSVVQSKIQELDTDRDQIRNRKNQLESVMMQLDRFGRKEN